MCGVMMALSNSCKGDVVEPHGGNFLGGDEVAHRFQIEDAVARYVHDDDAVFHGGKLLGAEHALGLGGLGHVNRDEVGDGEHVVHVFVQLDSEETIFSEAVDTEDYNAVGIGPGLGQSETTAVALIAQLRRTQCPIIADADALNILSNHRAWMMQLPQGIILTPHPKEFDRLEGHCTDSYERLTKARELAERLQGYVILKGHHSALCCPDGHVTFNNTGNAGMATAGSGDVLTGIITALLARGYKQKEACMVGMYLHGMAGDIAAKHLGMESLMASDLIQYLPEAFKRLND